tara:strand:+ start:1601 stop:1804 length:204 start_codon:yes stop_codon:yes gene_type:complete
MHKAKYLGKAGFKCEMCLSSALHHNKYRLTMGMTGSILVVCKKCIYREMFGTKKMKSQMKEGVLENG